ncbi:hypothetical protein FSPOR_6922 [Fusarium sporotrichioides]|uniref:Uncharacterized protein n=1 Tax=Fusarium sporotrichioides TaxID=5514 RepID=A0A395S114_FUSSP|nr:hypothetical protein FSPOR_6922 [Fusarium sporotrichioides]
MSSSQTSSQELSDMRNSQPLETNQPQAQHSMDPQKAPETTEPTLELRGGGACDALDKTPITTQETKDKDSEPSITCSGTSQFWV